MMELNDGQVERGSVSPEIVRHVITRLCHSGFELIASGSIAPQHPELAVVRDGATYAWFSVAEPTPGWLYLADDSDLSSGVSPTVRGDRSAGRHRFHLETIAEADHVIDILLKYWGVDQ